MFDYTTLIESLDDLPPKCRKLAELIGLDVYLELCRKLKGRAVYFPDGYKLARTQLANALKREYLQGVAVETLADKYKLTAMTIYNLLGGVVKQVKNMPMDGQISLFGDV